MSDIVIDGYKINTPIVSILKQLQLETPYLHDIRDKKTYYEITCPFHKNGGEARPSCSVYYRQDNDKIPYGTYHCFTCDAKGTFFNLAKFCLNSTVSDTKNWFLSRFDCEKVRDDELTVDFADEKSKPPKSQFLDESILKNYNFYHPYMWKRKLTKEVVDRFQIGYNRERDTITFPVFDKNHRLVMITERCTSSKKFYIPANIEKPIYLLDAVLAENIKTVYVCESQINALTLWAKGIPAIALFGCELTPYQQSILSRCPIEHYVLALDPDGAGVKGTNHFIKCINKDAFVDVFYIPFHGKDINDLSDEEFQSCKIISVNEWRTKFTLDTSPNS